LKEAYLQLKGIYNYSILGPEDIKEIQIELVKLVGLRGENYDDYQFLLWYDFWRDNGYMKSQILEMISYAKELPKYGMNRLALGDVIKNWERITEGEKPVKWEVIKQSINMLLKKDMEMMNQIARMITGMDFISKGDRAKYKKFIDDRIEEYYAKIHSEEYLKKQEELNAYLRKLMEDNERLKEAVTGRLKKMYKNDKLNIDEKLNPEKIKTIH
jgi:hypothetical protein